MPAEISMKDLPLSEELAQAGSPVRSLNVPNLLPGIEKIAEYEAKSHGDELICSFEKLHCDHADRGATTVRLRTSSNSGQRVKCLLGQDVSIEVWNKRTSDLVAMGRLTISDRTSVEVDCFEVWEGGLFGTVILCITQAFDPVKLQEVTQIAPLKPVLKTLPAIVIPAFEPSSTVRSLKEGTAEPILLEPSIDSGRTSITYEKLFAKPIPVSNSVESFISFISNDDVTGEEERQPAVFRPPPLPLVPRISSPVTSEIEKKAQSYVRSLSEQLETSSVDARSLLFQNIQDLEDITARLTGIQPAAVLKQPPEQVDYSPVSSDQSPISLDYHTEFIPPPDFSNLFLRETHRPRSSRKKRKDKREEFKDSISDKKEISNVPNQPHVNLSMISGISPIVIRREADEELASIEPISVKRKQSIEKARRNISTLRGSLLKDADQITAVLESTGQLSREE
jgi:hypothetical protein